MVADGEGAGIRGEPVASGLAAGDGGAVSAAADRFARRAEELRTTTIMARRILRAFETGIGAVDRRRLAALDDFVAAHPGAATDPLETKYLDLPFYIKDKARWIVDLRLDDSAPRAILDLGTGGGHFPFLAKTYGHRVVGIDLDVVLYRQVLQVYDVPRIVHCIEPGAALPVSDRFDLISALQITFNRKPGVAVSEGTGVYWTAKEWSEFVAELCRHLIYPGRIFFGFNRQTMPSGQHHADDLLDLFEANGARVDYYKYTALLELTEPVTLRY